MQKVSVETKIIDTLFLGIVVVISAYILNSALLRWLMELGFVLSLGEIFLTVYIKRDSLKPVIFGILPKKSHYILIISFLITLASIALFLFTPKPNEFVLFFGAIISADAGGLFFGKFFGKSRPWFSRRLSPNKTWVGYFGEFATCWTVCTLIILIFGVDMTPANRWFVALAPLFGTIGDLSASGAKRQLGIKDSGEAFRDIPILGKLEWFIKSRDGFLDCFDSISTAFLYYAIISLILA